MSAELFRGNDVKKFGQLVDKLNIDGVDYYTFTSVLQVVVIL